MVLFSAVNLGLVLVGAQTTPPVTTTPSDSAYRKIERSVGVVMSGSTPIAMGVMIDSNGLMLTHDHVGLGGILSVRFSDSQTGSAEVYARDPQTRLALIKVVTTAIINRPPVRLSPGIAGRPIVFAVSPTGLVRGQMIPEPRVGLMKPDNRYLPLTEFRFDSNFSTSMGAPVFDGAGGLLGLLAATVTVPTAAAPGARGGSGLNITESAFGPSGMTVAYSVSLRALTRVLDGLGSAERKVQHPNIGASFKTDERGGAVITEVDAGSPSAEAGLKVGYVVLSADGIEITDAVGFASFLFDREVGEKVELRVRTAEGTKTLTITIGLAPSYD